MNDQDNKNNIPNNEQEQFDYIARFGVYDKDKEISNKKILKKSNISKKRNHHTETEADFYLDLHGYNVDEAIVAVEEAIYTMEKSRLKILRIVHGGGNPGYGPIKKALDREFRGPLRNRIKFHRVETYNSGSSLVWLV